VEYPIADKTYEHDFITTQTSLNLAGSAYLAGCVTRSKELGAKNSFDLCLERAKQYLRDDVVFILDQDPTKKAQQRSTEP